MDTERLLIGVRAPKNKDINDKISVGDISVKQTSGPPLTFRVAVATSKNYVVDEAFVVETSPSRRVVLKLKAIKMKSEKDSKFNRRMTRVAKAYAEKIERGANDGIYEFAQPFVDANYLKVDSEPAIRKPGLAKFKAYQVLIDEIIASVNATDPITGEIIGTLPWKAPYVQYPTMNFFKLYTAYRRRMKNKDPKKTFVPMMRDKGLRYKGINNLRLAQDFMPGRPRSEQATRTKLPFYVTEKQAASLGGTVLRGATRIKLVFWKMADDPLHTMTTEQRMMNGFPIQFEVVRVDEVVGVAFEDKVNAVTQYLRAEKGLRGESAHDPNGGAANAAGQNMLAAIQKRVPAPMITEAQTETPYYSHVRNEITIPPRDAFKGGAAAYYTTIFHEIVHWSGGKDQLNRAGELGGAVPAKKVRGFAAGHASESYSKEELVAEIGAYLIASEAGFGPVVMPNSAAYISSWLKKLQKTFLLTSAATLATKAVEYILEEYYGEEYYQDDTDHIELDEADAAERFALIELIEALNAFSEREGEGDYLSSTETLVAEVGAILKLHAEVVPQPYREYFIEAGAYQRIWLEYEPVDVLASVGQLTDRLKVNLGAIPMPHDPAGPEAILVEGRLFAPHVRLGESFGAAFAGAVVWTAGDAAVVTRAGEMAPVCHHVHDAHTLCTWLSSCPANPRHLCPSCSDT